MARDNRGPRPDGAAVRLEILDLCRQGRTREAIPLLKQLADGRSALDPKIVEWAASQLNRLGGSASSGAAVDAEALRQTAEELFEKYDYEEAVSLLESIPAAERSAEARELHKASKELRDEVRSLLEELKVGIETRRVEDLEPALDRLLEISPVNSYGKNLKATLETYQKVPRGRRKYRYSRSGDLLSAGSDGVSPSLIAGLVVVLVIGALAWQTWYGPTARLVVQVDPTNPGGWVPGGGGGIGGAAGVPRLPADLELHIGDIRVALQHGKAEILLAPGEYVYEVFAGAIRLLGPVRIKVELNAPNLLTLMPPGEAPAADVAAAPAPARPAPGLALDGQPVADWGTLISPKGDCAFTATGRSGVLTVSAGDHALSVESGRMSAPRVMRNVRGDFAFQIEVSGVDLPQGPSVTRSRPFISAGIVVWKDEKNYLRFERAGLTYTPGAWNYVGWAHHGNGRLVTPANIQVGRTTSPRTTLRILRTGNRFDGWYMNGGGPLMPLKPFDLDWPVDLQIGVVGNNTTDREFTASLEWSDPQALPAPFPQGIR